MSANVSSPREENHEQDRMPYLWGARTTQEQHEQVTPRKGLAASPLMTKVRIWEENTGQKQPLAGVHSWLALASIQPDIQWGRSELGAGEVIDARMTGTSGPLEPAKGMWPFFPCRSQCQSESGAVPWLDVLKDISELL